MKNRKKQKQSWKKKTTAKKKTVPGKKPRPGKSKRKIDVRVDFKDCPFGSRKIRSIVESVMKSEKLSGNVSVYVTNNRNIRKLNRQFLGRDNITDVLAFPLEDSFDVEPMLGEIVISAQIAKDRVPSPKYMYVSEIARYIIHGILHLGGYRDHNPASRKKIRQKEDFYLRKNKFRLA